MVEIPDPPSIFLPFLVPAFQAKRGGIVEKIPEIDKIQRGQKGKFQNSLNGTPWTPAPKLFFNLLTDQAFSPLEFCATMAAWNYFQSSDEIRVNEFDLTRKKLSQLANTGERQAGEVLARLENIGLLSRLSGRRGIVNKWAWNVDRIRDLNFYLYPTGTTYCTPQVQPLYPTGTTLVPHGYLVFIYILLNNIKQSYTGFFATLNHVDNFNHGNKKGGHDWPEYSWEKFEASLMAAILATWNLAGRGGIHGLHEIQTALQGQFCDPRKVSDVTEYLRELLNNEEEIHALQNKFPLHSKSEIELFQYLIEINKLETNLEVDQ